MRKVVVGSKDMSQSGIFTFQQGALAILTSGSNYSKPMFKEVNTVIARARALCVCMKERGMDPIGSM